MQGKNRIIGIVGPRGVGKTTFLLHSVLKNQNNAIETLYVSADHLYFLEHSLLNLVDQLYKETDVRSLMIDEIHKYDNWIQELKNIYDTYLDFKIIFSGSSAIDLVNSKYDLSRRVTLYSLHAFSFREYLESTHHYQMPSLNLEDIFLGHTKISENLEVPKILKYFNDYLKSGYYPFFARSNYVL